jgi:hypothetical protein
MTASFTLPRSHGKILIIKRKDYLLSSHLWGDIAAFNGNASGDGLRDAIPIKITSSETAKAQKLARECVREKYKGC